jgi:hypothetical protein
MQELIDLWQPLTVASTLGLGLGVGLSSAWGAFARWQDPLAWTRHNALWRSSRRQTESRVVLMAPPKWRDVVQNTPPPLPVAAAAVVVPHRGEPKAEDRAETQRVPEVSRAVSLETVLVSAAGPHETESRVVPMAPPKWRDVVQNTPPPLPVAAAAVVVPHRGEPKAEDRAETQRVPEVSRAVSLETVLVSAAGPHETESVSQPPRFIYSPRQQVSEFVAFMIREGYLGRRTDLEWIEAYLRWAKGRSIAVAAPNVFLTLLGKHEAISKCRSRLKCPRTGRVIKNHNGTPMRGSFYELHDLEIEAPKPSRMRERYGVPTAHEQRRAA